MRWTPGGVSGNIEDERDSGKEEVQTLLKKFEDKITEMADKKSKDIMEQ